MSPHRRSGAPLAAYVPEDVYDEAADLAERDGLRLTIWLQQLVADRVCSSEPLDVQANEIGYGAQVIRRKGKPLCPIIAYGSQALCRDVRERAREAGVSVSSWLASVVREAVGVRERLRLASEAKREDALVELALPRCPQGHTLREGDWRPRTRKSRATGREIKVGGTCRHCKNERDLASLRRRRAAKARGR